MKRIFVRPGTILSIQISPVNNALVVHIVLSLVTPRVTDNKHKTKQAGTKQPY